MVIAFTIRIILLFLFLFLFYLDSFIYLDSFFYFSFIAIIEIDEIQVILRWVKITDLFISVLLPVFDWIFSIFFCYIEIENCHVINSDTYDAYIHCIFYIYMFWLRLYMLIILIWIYYTSVHIAYICTYASICFIVYFEMYVWNVLCILIITNTNKETVIFFYFLQSIFTLLKYIYSNIYIFW